MHSCVQLECISAQLCSCHICIPMHTPLASHLRTAGEATQAWTADVHGPQPAQQGAASSAPHRCTAGTSLHSQGCHEDDAPSSSLHRQPPAVNAAHGADASHGAVPVVQQQPRQQPQKEGPLQVSLETAKGGAGGKPAHHQGERAGHMLMRALPFVLSAVRSCLTTCLE